MNCKHRDCFTCPYEDCINDPETVKLRKKAIKKDASEKTEKRRQYMQDWYKAHRQERINKAMDRYWKKKSANKKSSRN